MGEGQGDTAGQGDAALLPDSCMSCVPEHFRIDELARCSALRPKSDDFGYPCLL